MQNAPPYVSWTSFLRTLDGFGGVTPERLDSTSLPGLSVSLASQMMQAFRFLGLIRPGGESTLELKLLAEHPESRAAVLPKVFRQSYPEVFGQGVGPLSEKALERVMARTGMSPATQRKAVTFVLNAASYMSLPVGMNTSKGPLTGPSTSPELSPAIDVTTPAKKSLIVDLTSG